MHAEVSRGCNPLTGSGRTAARHRILSSIEKDPQTCPDARHLMHGARLPRSYAELAMPNGAAIEAAARLLVRSQPASVRSPDS
jgi:hypothetical protein